MNIPQTIPPGVANTLNERVSRGDFDAQVSDSVYEFVQGNNVVTLWAGKFPHGFVKKDTRRANEIREMKKQRDDKSCTPKPS